MPSFLRGAARTLDLFGTLNEYPADEPPEMADASALRSDWLAVGRDLRTVIATCPVLESLTLPKPFRLNANDAHKLDAGDRVEVRSAAADRYSS